MPSLYYKNHEKQLEALKTLYELDKRPFIQYRAKCIKDLLLQEKVKDE